MATICGYEKERNELKQFREMLLNFESYLEKGIRIPKGVLVSGKPGVGKTAMVREMVDGMNVVELKVATFSKDEIPGKIEEAFKEAKSKTPCVIFIDELDKIASERKDFRTREMTQASKVLLGELDKLSNDEALLVIATCNDKESIPKMLIRSGRFDRIITIGHPSNDDRKKIIEHYLSIIKIEKNLEIEELSNLLTGFTGAEIENFVNDAAIIAVHKETETLTLDDFKEARSNRRLCALSGDPIEDKKEKHILAVHEAGHAVCTMILSPDVIDSVTIIPKGQSGGCVTLNVTNMEAATMSHYLDQITSLLASKASEILLLGDMSCGCASDIDTAVEVGKYLVSSSYFGFEASIGYNDFISGNKEKANQMLGKCLDEQYQRAYKILEENKELLCRVVSELEEKNTLCKGELEDIKKEVGLGRGEEMFKENRNIEKVSA